MPLLQKFDVFLV